MPKSTCSESECLREVRSRGLCLMHYKRLWRNGNHVNIPTISESLGLERFWLKVEKTGTCWVWKSAPTSKGYGSFWFNGKGIQAHRFSYELLVGPIPEDLTLDHLCRNRLCVRPDHLEPVTRGVNVLRGEGPGAQNARKTHCPYNHEYTPENTYVVNRHKTGRTYRICKECSRIRYANKKKK